MINDENYPSQHSMIAMGVAGNSTVTGFHVDNVFPNPFSVSLGDGLVAIQFAINEAQPVSVKIFDQLGKEIFTGVEATYAAGTHQVKWDGRDNGGNQMAAGVYYYNLTAGGSTLTGKINLSK
jgi:flagellar hook assembly protein FlgD